LNFIEKAVLVEATSLAVHKKLVHENAHQDEVHTQSIKVRQPFIHTPSQLCPLRKLVLCTRLQQLRLRI